MKVRTAMLKVTFMGTGDAYAARHRSNVSLLIHEGDVTFQIECGPTVLQQLDRASSAPDQVTHLFISHRHGDHVLGLPMFLLLRSMGGAAGPLTVLGNPDVIQTGRQLMELVYTELRDRLTAVKWVALATDEPSSQEITLALRISTLPTPHSQKTPSLGVRLDFLKSGRSVVYTGDTTHTEEMAQFAAGCDLLIHEANFSQVLHPGVNAAGYGHSTARQAGHTAAQANCRILALVHISGDYDGREDQVCAEAAQEFNGEIIIPNDGATLYL
jgi:ribonuclease Z